MKFSSSLILLISILSSVHAQIDLKNYVEVPVLSKKVKFNEGTIDHGDVQIFVHKEDPKGEEVVFGSWLKMVINDIEEKNVFEGYEFHLTRQIIINSITNDTILSTNWTTDSDEEELIKASGNADLKMAFKMNVGTPMIPGKYKWVVEMADMCANKKTSIYVDFKLIQSPFIKVETSGNLKIPVAYFMNRDKEFIYTSDSLNPGNLAVYFWDLSGLTEEDGVAKFGLSAVLMDEKGDSIYYDEDLASGSNAFIDVNKLKNNNLKYKFDVANSSSGKYRVLKIKIWDKLDEQNFAVIESRFYVR